MIEVKNSEYGLYQGKLYRIGKTCVASVDLCSINPDDLNNGFIRNHTEDFMKKYGFVCIKEVPRNEITEAYEIRTYAIYREKKFDVNPWYEDIQLIIGFDRITEADKIKEIKSWGFTELQFERTSTTFEKIVSLDDPELKIIEERKTLDISKL